MTSLLTNTSHAIALSIWLTILGLAQPQSNPIDIDTSPFNTLYKWKQMDFEFPSSLHRSQALASGKFVPENVIPVGVEVWGSRIFVSTPGWKRGVPATLSTLSRSSGVTSPPLKPYPNWNLHRDPGDRVNCTKLTSIFRMNVDQCGRLWALDSGQLTYIDSPKQICPSSIVLFDLQSDKLIARYIIPEEFVLQDSLFANIVVDSRQSDCSDLHLYIADTGRFGLLVFRQRDQKFWRFSNHLFYPEPMASNYSLHGLNFQWTEGIFGLALTPEDRYGQRLLYFHAMSSDKEFYVPTSILRQPERISDSTEDFKLAGESRGSFGQASTSAIDRRGVMFFGLITRDSIGCWDSNKPYLKRTTGVVALNTETLIFPNDLRIDHEPRQSVWVIPNRVPMFLLRPWNVNEYNFRILYADAISAVRGTICDPTVIL